MAKKAKTVSWRTLVRRAKKAPKAEAAALKAEAAKLRRAERASKKPKRKVLWGVLKHREAELKAAGVSKKIPSFNELKARQNQLAEQPATQALTGSMVRSRQLEAGQASIALMGKAHGSPGHGEIIGGRASYIAENVVKLARKKGGKDRVQKEIEDCLDIVRREGVREGQMREMDRVTTTYQGIYSSIVCGFVAAVDHLQRNGMPPDQVILIPGFTALRIVDALNKAGYTAKGKT